MAKELIGELELNRIYQRDCIKGMKMLPNKSIDMILCDLPYGTTACSWDSIIPFDSLWEQYERVIKDNGAIVLTASQPFTTALGGSKINLLKYSLVWEKNRPTGFAHAKNKPLKSHEDILVFSKGTTVHKGQSKTRMTYNPQGLVEINKPMKNRESHVSNTSFTKRPSHRDYVQTHTNYPRSVLKFDMDEEKLHPTQKPVALFEYLIQTYTDESEIILDNCMGSGTTAVAAVRTNRKFIGFETEPSYVEIANKRLDNETEAEA